MIIGLLFFSLQHRNQETQDNMVKFMNAVQDSTYHKIDNLGRKYSQTSQIRYNDPKVFLNVKSSDPSVIALQKEVNDLKGKMRDGSSVTNFSNDLHIDVPIVSGKFSDKWVNIDNSLENRSVVDVKNKYSVSLIEDKGEYVVNVRNDNPYSKGVDSVKTFVKTPKPEKKWSIGVGIGYNAKGEILPFAGITYNILNLF